MKVLKYDLRLEVHRKSTILSHTDPNHKLWIKEDYTKSSFLSDSNKFKINVKIINKIILSKKFREKLFEDKKRALNSTNK